MKNRSQTSNTSSSGGTTNSIGQTSDKYVSNGKVTAKDHKQINDKTVHFYNNVHSHDDVHSYDDSIDNNSANFVGNTISQDPIPMLNNNIIDIGDAQIQQYLEKARYRIDSQLEFIEKANNYVKDKNYSHANEIVEHVDTE